MEFSISKKNLLECLNHFQSVVEKRNTIPILSNIKVIVDESNGLEITATDLAMEISETLSANIIKSGGKKFENKKYYKHTGYPGGIKEITPYELKKRNRSHDVLKFAVKRMLPGGPLAKKQLSKLKMYYGENHPHSSQNPVEINFSKLNKKNKI